MQQVIPALEVAGLHVEVPGRVLVDDLNFAARPGDFIAILGRNGVGKTLTLHTLAGLRPADGDVALFESALDSMSRRQIAKQLALLPQSIDDLFPATVLETALVGRHPHLPALRMPDKDDLQKTDSALDQLGLGGMQDRDVATLSGGERRRLAIAQILVQEPSIYLLDEPVNHLDPQHQLDSLALFAALAATGATVIATIHDINLAQRFANRCLLLHGDGRWQLGDTESMLTSDRLAELYRVGVETVDWHGRPAFMIVDGEQPRR